MAAAVVYEEVAESVYGVVVDAVFEGQFGWCGSAGVGIVVASHGFDQSPAAGGDHEGAGSVSGSDRPSDKLDAFEDAAFPVTCSDSGLAKLANGAGSCDIINSCAGRVAEGGGQLILAHWSADFYLRSVYVDCCSGADVLVDHANFAIVIRLNPEAHEGIDESEIKRAIQGQAGVEVNGTDVQGRIEFGEDDVFERRAQAQHFGFPAGSAGAAHLRYAIVDFEIAGGVLRLALTVGPEGALRTVSVGALLDCLPDAPFEDRCFALGSCGDRLLHESVGAVHCADQFHCSADSVRALRGELGGCKDLIVEEFDFVAAELLDVLTSDACRGLRE